MKKVMIIAMIIVGLLFVPAVSAEIIIDETLSDFVDTGGSGVYVAPGGGNYASGLYVGGIGILDISKCENLHYVVITRDGKAGNRGEGEYHLTYSLAGGPQKPCVLYVSYTKNILNQITGTRFTLFFDDWSIGSLTGQQKISLSSHLWTGEYAGGLSGLTTDNLFVCGLGSGYSMDTRAPYNIYFQSNIEWYNHLTVSDTVGGSYQVELQREFNGKYYISTLTIYDSAEVVVYEDVKSTDLSEIFTKSMVDKITLTSFDRTYEWILGGSSLGTAPLTVYVRNSQTGALLADAHIEIQDTTTEPWTEVVNQTLTSGQGTISLAKDSGIHLAQYRIGATIPGYQQVVPALFFRVTGPTNVIVEMEPTSGGPVNENNTFLEFYVRDISANAIANANVQVDGQLRWTNAQGYTQFEVAKNASYPYIVTKTGYLTIEGIARVESNDRYVVNVALMAGVVPTQPTVSPTITVEPTPTQTTPPIREDNIIGLSVSGLAKGFGIDYDTALLMFGLMIIFGAGGMVMSSVKGGAMEFIAGSIVGTFVAFALGLIPIWIFIIIAVVFGAYVLRVFIQGGQ